MYIGEIIKEYRITNNLSQRAFASRTTLSPSYINTLEKIYNPKTNKPYSVTTDVANEIAKAMNMNIEELLSKINGNQEFTTSNSIPLTELYKDKVPLLGTVKAGYDYLANENVLDYIPITIKKEDNNYYALKIKRRQHGNSDG
ncbi:MAG: helix-turn-helix domain-containing protein [Clostridia bacterium]|nr:helix-turn-helix domain-containing protein [Clostridia bacterium]